MYKFKIEKKDDVLKGRTVKYFAEDILLVNQCYLSSILNGNVNCSKRLAKCITDNANGEKIEDFFEKTK